MEEFEAITSDMEDFTDDEEESTLQDSVETHSTSGSPTPLTTQPDDTARNRERNRLHARQSRQRRKVSMESMRMDGRQLQDEQLALMELYRKAVGSEYTSKVSPIKITTTDVDFKVAAALGPIRSGMMDADEGAAGKTTDSTERMERTRLRNKLHAKKSRLRRKALVDYLKASILAMRENVADLRHALSERLGDSHADLARIPRTDLSTSLGDLLPRKSRAIKPITPTGPPARGRPRKVQPAEAGLMTETTIGGAAALMGFNNHAGLEEASGGEEEGEDLDVSSRGRRRRKAPMDSLYDMRSYGKGSRGGKTRTSTRSPSDRLSVAEDTEIKQEPTVAVAGGKRARNTTSTKERNVRARVEGQQAGEATINDRQDRADAANLLVFLAGPSRYADDDA